MAHSLAPCVELTGGVARLPAVGAKNWPFGTLVAVELVLPPRFMLSPIPCFVSGKKEKAWSSKSVELKAYDVVVKVRGGEDSGEGNGEREMSANRAGYLKGLLRGTGLVARAELAQHALLVARHADLVQPALLVIGRVGPAGDGLGSDCHNGFHHVRGGGGAEGHGDADEHERAEARSALLRL